MRTTLDLDEALISELLKVTAARSKTEAIHLAVAELLRRRKLDALKSLSGKVRIDVNWARRERVETTHQKRLASRWRGHR